MSDCILVFKAGASGIFALGFSVGMAMVKLTDNENLICNFMTLGGVGMEQKQCFWELVLFMHGMICFLFFLQFEHETGNIKSAKACYQQWSPNALLSKAATGTCPSRTGFWVELLLKALGWLVDHVRAGVCCQSPVLPRGTLAPRADGVSSLSITINKEYSAAVCLWAGK